MTITKFTIFGERCSGTNYLEEIILENFKVDVTWKYGWKHFFGFLDHTLKDSDDTLFICITRDICDWLNSLYFQPHHLSHHMLKSPSHFLGTQAYSNPSTWSCKEYYGAHWKMLGEDRNINTKQRYKNIFEMRHVKHQYMYEILPKKVNNYIFIRYEDLLHNFEHVMKKIQEKGFIVKDENTFPKNIEYYKKYKDVKYKKIKKTSYFNKESIVKHPYFKPYYEILFNYI